MKNLNKTFWYACFAIGGIALSGIVSLFGLYLSPVVMQLNFLFAVMCGWIAGNLFALWIEEMQP